MVGQFSQATRSRNIGQLSDLIQEYRKQDSSPSVDGWKDFYYQQMGKEKIDTASEKIWDYFQRMLLNMQTITKENIDEWVHELVIDKTFSGLQLQNDILEMVSTTGEWRLATPDEESKGIDGVVDGEFVSIKPHTYKSTLASKNENIPYRTIFYKKTFNGLIIDDTQPI